MIYGWEKYYDPSDVLESIIDENGEKISKSRGNGLTVEEWLHYAPPQSLSYFMFQKPKTAKRLYFDVIPRQVDEYARMLDAYESQEPAKRIDNPAWFIHMGEPPAERAHLSFGILLNLASVCHSEDKAVLWHFISRYRPDANPETAPMLDRLVEYAINYYRDFVRPAKSYRKATDAEASDSHPSQAGPSGHRPSDAQAARSSRRHDSMY